MPITTVRLADLGRTIARDMRAQKDAAERAMRVVVHTEAPRILQEEIARAQPRPPVDRASYKNGWQIRDTAGGVEIFNASAQAAVIEDGRRPGRMPPIDALVAWVIRKGLVGDKPRERSNARSSEKTHAKAATARAEFYGRARGIAFAIAQKMAKQGWPFAPNKPMGILAKTCDRLRPLVRAAVDKALSGEAAP